MDWIASGVTDQYIYFLGVDSVDLQTPETGLSGFSVSRSRNGGTLTAMTTPTVSHLGNGLYRLLLDEDMTIGAGNITESMAFYITATGMKPVYKSIVLYNADYWATAANLTTVDTVVDGIKTVTDNLPNSGALSSLATASALSTVDTEVGQIKAVTDNLPDSGALSSLATASALSTADGKLDDIQGATFNTSTDSLEAIRNRGDSAWTTGAGGTPPQLLQSTTIATLSTQTSFTLTAGSADNDAYNGAIAIVTDQSTATQKAVGRISDYVGSTKTVTLASDPGIFTMAVGDTIDILAAISTAPTVEEIAGAVMDEPLAGYTTAGTAGKTLSDILADTNELQQDDIPGAISALNDFDPATDTVAHVTLVDTTTTNTDMRGTDSAATASALSTMQGNVTSILQDTGTTIPGTISTMQGNVTDILEDTGTTIPGTLSTIGSNVSDILTDTAEIGAAGAGLTALASASSQSTIASNVSSILTDTATSIPALLSSLDGKIDTLDSVADAVKAKTDNLPSDPADASDIATATDAIAAALSALNDISVDDILSTQITEAYAADGTAPTIPQALLWIQQLLTDFSISGTSLTVKKLDGTTTAGTITLNDGTTPTAASRTA